MADKADIKIVWMFYTEGGFHNEKGSSSGDFADSHFFLSKT